MAFSHLRSSCTSSASLDVLGAVWYFSRHIYIRRVGNRRVKAYEICLPTENESGRVNEQHEHGGDMKPAIILTAISLATVATIVAAAQQEQLGAVEIPIDKIWAFNMPGTRDIRKLEPGEIDKNSESVWKRTVEALVGKSADATRKKESVGQGFAVAGNGLDALRRVNAVIATGETARSSFDPNDEISIVFFSYLASGNNVHVQEVSRKAGAIEVKFRLAPYFERNMSLSFTLIPVGKMPPGTYQVQFVQSPIAKSLSTVV